jgi:hypothetical protein
MERLNYFHPYQSKAGSHEDQLTRAYLVLLKHSSHAFFTFFEYCRSRHKTSGSERAISLIELLESGWELRTQQGNPTINTAFLLSVLITDVVLQPAKSGIHSSERNARYDGLLTFGSTLTMVIENKPRSGNVWFEQLNPSRQNLADDTIVYSNPAVLEWKEIIKHLNHLLTVPTVAGYEKLMIEDFLSYIDENFSALNPYDNLYQCKGNKELIQRRIHHLLQEIALDDSKVNYHKGWGYYIQTPYEQIQQIGLIQTQDDKEQSLELSLYFGDSQRQAIAFYKSTPSIEHLKEANWRYWPNFHVSFMTSNLVWFQSEDDDIYLQYWRDNVDEIYQRRRSEVEPYLKHLVEKRVITMTKQTEEQLEERFYKTAMQTLNICPGFAFTFTYKLAQAIELDRHGQLKRSLSETIKEGLKVVGLDGNELLKQH